MVQCNSIETHNLCPDLNNQEQFRLNKSMKLMIV